MAIPSIELSSVLANVKLKPLKTPKNADDPKEVAKVAAQNAKIAQQNEKAVDKAVDKIVAKIEAFEAKVLAGKSATLNLGKGFEPIKFDAKTDEAPTGPLAVTLGGVPVDLDVLADTPASELVDIVENGGTPQDSGDPTTPPPPPAPEPPPAPPPVTPTPTPVNGTRANPATAATAGNDILDGTVGAFNAPVTYSAAGGDDEFVINTNVRSNPANLVIQSFGAGDKLVFGVASTAGGISQLNSIYSLSDNGSNITLTANSDGVVQTIQLANITASRAGVGGAVDSISELATLLGNAAVEVFSDPTAAPSANGSIASPASSTTAGNDVVDGTRGSVSGSRTTYDAGQGNDQFVIDANVAENSSNVDILNFRAGDRLLFDVADASAGLGQLSNYSVADNGSNVTIVANANGVVQRIALIGIPGDRGSVGGAIDSISELSAFLGNDAVGLI